MTRLETASDELLAERSADGDTAAFSVLVRRHAPSLRAFAARLTGSMADADDCVQEALITAWGKLPDLQEPQHVRAWLMTIVSRKATDRLRSRRPSEQIDDLEIEAREPSPERRAVASSQLDALRAALDGLPPDQRVVWLLKEVGDHTYEEIAAQLDVPTATVRGRLARARATVLEKMQEWR